MLTLDNDQTSQLKLGDARRFVEAVCEQFLADRPELKDPVNRAETLRKMQAAFEYADRIGLRSTPHVIVLMYLSVDSPYFHDDPETDRYLRKPGATPEQRLDDLVAVLKATLADMENSD
jgi:hypothetical protein